MKIGIDCRMYSSQFTGIGRYVFELVEHLQHIDKKNHYYLFFNRPQFDEFKAKNPLFHKVLVEAKHYSLPEQTKFLQILNSHQLDLMHFTHFNAPIFYNRPSLVTIHDLTLHFYPGKKMTSFLHRLAYNLTIKSTVKKAGKVIAVSQSTSHDLQKILGTPSSKIEVIYEGVNPEFKPITSPEIIRPTLLKYKINKPFLLYTGVWRDHKNLKGLIEAFKILRQKHSIQLVITGKNDTIYAEEILKLADQYLKDNQIIFTGLVSEKELIHLLNAAKIYTFPSFYEGFGLPPLEAMQCHTPVAASDSSSIPEVCGDNAVYFNPHSPTDMAEKIEKLLTNETLYQHLISTGSRHVKNFSWHKMSEQTHHIYLDLLSEFRSSKNHS